MKHHILAAFVLVVMVGITSAAEPGAKELSRTIIERENARLVESIRNTRTFMQRARIVARTRSLQCEHAIARMEAAIAMYNLVLEHDGPALLVATALTITEGRLEKNYTDQIESQARAAESPQDSARQQKELRQQEQELLADLKVLKEWNR